MNNENLGEYLACLKQGVSEGKISRFTTGESRSGSLKSYKNEFGLYLGVKGKPLEIRQSSNWSDLYFRRVILAAIWHWSGGV